MSNFLNQANVIQAQVPESRLLARALANNGGPVYGMGQGIANLGEDILLAVMERRAREKQEAEEKKDSDFISNTLANSFRDIGNENLMRAPDGRVFDPTRAQDPSLINAASDGSATQLDANQRGSFAVGNMLRDPRTANSAPAVASLAQQFRQTPKARPATQEEIASFLGVERVPVGTQGTVTPDVPGVSNIQFPQMTDVEGPGGGVQRVSEVRANDEGLPRSRTPPIQVTNEAPTPESVEVARRKAGIARETKAADAIFEDALSRGEAAVGVMTELQNQSELLQEGLNTGNTAIIRNAAAGFFVDFGLDRGAVETFFNADLSGTGEFRRSEAALAGQFIKIFGGTRPTDADLEQARRLVATVQQDETAVVGLIEFAQELAQRDLDYRDAIVAANRNGDSLLDVQQSFQRRYGKAIDIDALDKSIQEDLKEINKPASNGNGQAIASDGVFASPLDAPDGAVLIPEVSDDGTIVYRVKK